MKQAKRRSSSGNSKKAKRKATRELEQPETKQEAKKRMHKEKGEQASNAAEYKRRTGHRWTVRARVVLPAAGFFLVGR